MFYELGFSGNGELEKLRETENNQHAEMSIFVSGFKRGNRGDGVGKFAIRAASSCSQYSSIYILSVIVMRTGSLS